MNKEDLKITNKHKANISMRVCILILGVVLASYMFKIFGADTFNKFITNELFIEISNFIDTNVVCNIFAYGVLGYIITQFVFCMTCKNVRLKWFEYFIVFVFAIGMSVLRYYFVGNITYLFDLLQYILVPIIYGLTRRENVVNNLMNTLIIYFVSNGIMLMNVTLCGLKAIMYTSNFIAYVLSFIEIYLFTIAITIFIINGGYSNVKSNVNIK